ncbi:hypothetical protein F2P79_005296 [Pimephales promelas]|nr:hypothetical protein F2P79_005296 [Pimephales promelas]
MAYRRDLSVLHARGFPRDVKDEIMNKSEPICTKALSSSRCIDEFSAACCVMTFQHHQQIITDQRGTGRQTCQM